jgi:hypothetical protein
VHHAFNTIQRPLNDVSTNPVEKGMRIQFVVLPQCHTAVCVQRPREEPQQQRETGSGGVEDETRGRVSKAEERGLCLCPPAALPTATSTELHDTRRRIGHT